MEKVQLKQQAKSLLLKGCYKMAANKYERLIQQGSQGFTQRQWAVLHLNQAICHQFMEHFQQALQLSNRAIEIDPTYDKAYYRRLQILRDMRNLEAALQSVPSWIRNQQIQNLLGEIREQYFSSLGIDDLLQEMSSGKQTKIQHTKENHQEFYRKLVAYAQQPAAPESIHKVSGKIAQYYSSLKNSQQQELLESFLQVLHKLNLKAHEKLISNKFVQEILEQFWKLFFQRGDPFLVQTFPKQQIKKEEFQLAKYAPSSAQLLYLLGRLVRHPQIQSEEVFEYGIQLADSLSAKPVSSNLGSEVQSMVRDLTQGLSRSMSHSKLGWLKRSLIVLDSLVRVHLNFEPTLVLGDMDLTSLVYLRYCYLREGPEMERIKVKQQAIYQFLVNNLDSFLVIFIFEQVIHRFDREIFKEAIPAIEEQIDMLKELGAIHKEQPSKGKVTTIEMAQQFQLVYTSLMLKIDLRHATSRINIGALLSHRHNRKTLYDQSLSDIILNTLLLLAISNQKSLLQILNHPHSLTDIVHEFLSNTFTQQLESLGIATSFIFIAVVDIEHEQSESYAKKMGVRPEEIQKARQLQGETQDPKLGKDLQEKRRAFIKYMAHHWSQIVAKMSMLLLRIREDRALSKWSKIVNQIAKVDVSRLHHPKIVESMLEAFKIEKAAVGQFFSILCKKINTSLLRYEQLQPMADVLAYTAENGQHELVIFQSLLGLINLSSNANCKIRVPLKVLQNCLFEQNKYIVHGALELLNNVLIYYEKEQIDKQATLKEVVEKYLNFYRQEAQASEEPLPLTDYSHPSRVYSTLISLAIVMDLEKLQEFQDWSHSQQGLLRIQSPRAITLFKMAMYMAMKSKLEGKWWGKFEGQLQELKEQNQGYWLKLRQYMR